MRMQTGMLAVALWVGCGVASAQSPNATTGKAIVATVDATQTAPPVSKYIFGMFIEHIGKTMYGPLWAEMLDDRKFYFPIVSETRRPACGRAGFRACSCASGDRLAAMKL